MQRCSLFQAMSNSAQLVSMSILCNLVACAGSAAEKGDVPVARAQPDASPREATTRPTGNGASATKPSQASPLDFTEWSNGLPRGWELLGPGGVTRDDAPGHEGKVSLRLTNSPDAASPAGVKSARDAAPFVGRRWTLTGWANCTPEGEAKPAIIIGAIGEYDQTIVRAAADVRPTATGWSSIRASIDVPADTKTVGIGMLVVGTGECAVGDMHEELTPVPERTTIAVTGVVSTAKGQPADQALVGIFAGEDLVQIATTSADGTFTTALPEGAYSFAASRDRAFAQSDGAVLVGKEKSVKLVMRDPSALISVSGSVPDARKSTPIIVMTGNGDDPARVIVLPDEKGRFVAWLPPARFYWAFRRGDSMAIGRKMRHGEERSISLGELITPDPMPNDVADWVAKQSIRLNSVDPDAPLPDALVKLVDGKSVVVAGEATHGSAEFSLLKQRIFRSLVEKRGFRVLAMEVSPHGCEAASAFVEKGEGTPEVAVAAFSAWPWKTIDVKSTLVWMRAWNSQHGEADKLHMQCFDAQSSVAAYRELEKFLRCAEPKEAESLSTPLGPLGPNGVGVYYERDAIARKAVWTGLRTLHDRFKSKRHLWAKTCGADAVAIAEDDLRQLEGAHGSRLDAERIRNPNEGWVSRDRSMAENIVRAVPKNLSGPGIFVWTHNVHASMEADGYDSMGAVLRQKLGKRVLLIGTAFDTGSFQAVDTRPDTVNGWIRKFEVTSLGEASLGGALASIAAKLGTDVLALDLRGQKPAIVSRWLSLLRPAWELGAGFGGETSMTIFPPPVERFDVLLFVRKVTRAVPLH
jgi:erythromycin esterase